MKQLTPEPVDVASRLGAAREQRLARHRGVVGAVAGGDVGVTPVDVENLVVRVSVGLTPGTVRARDNRRVGEEVRHLILARIRFAINPTLAEGGSPRKKSRRPS